MTDNNLHGIFDEIARLATDIKRAAEGNCPDARHIVQLANRGRAMLGRPDEVMASKAAMVKKRIAEGASADVAVREAKLDQP